MSVKWYTVLALCFACLDVCYPACSSQKDCYSPDIITAYRPLVESIMRCTRRECVCNLCFERNSVRGEPEYCVVASGCWHFVDYNSTHQTCARNAKSEALGASTGVLLGGFILCIPLGIFLWGLWEVRAQKNKAFFVRHKRFAIRFIKVYFTSLTILLGVCGTGLSITFAVLHFNFCISERSDDDDDYDVYISSTPF